MNHSLRQAFADTVFDLATDNPDIFVVNADLETSLRLDRFAARFKNRFVQCGVAENNAAGVAAGIAHTGKIVFLTSYSCFSPGLNWATIKQSIVYNQSNVKIIGSHSGLMNYDLGATHQMLEDIALMRSLPRIDVLAPIDALETKKIIQTIVKSPKPAYIRLVSPETPIVSKTSLPFTIGKSHILQKGDKVTILGYGPILTQAFAIKNKGIEIINCSSIKPLDEATILASVKKTKRLIVLEDHQCNGGLGQAVASLILSRGLHPRFIHLAVDDAFGRSAHDYQTLYDYYGLGPDALSRAVTKILQK